MQQFFLSDERDEGEPLPPGAGRGRQVRVVAEIGARFARGGRIPPPSGGYRVDTVCLTPPPPTGAGEVEERFFAFFREAREVFDGAELILSPPEVAPVRADFSRRGVRGLLRESDLFEAFFRAAYRTSALARASLLLPFVNDPGEANAIRQCAEKALRTLLYHREPFDETIPIGIRVETPAAVLCGRRLLEDWDFAVADTDSLAAFALALPEGERPSRCGRDILFRYVEDFSETAHVCGRFCGIAGFLAADTVALSRLLSFGADALFLPPEKLPAVCGALAKCR